MSGFDRKEPSTADARERAGVREVETAPAADAPLFGDRRATAPPAILQLQRLAGNRAVSSMMPRTRRQPAGADDDEVIARREEPAAGDGLRARDVTSLENPFDFRRDPQQSVQRYKKSAGFKKTAVTMESSDFTAKAVSPLYIKKSAARLRIGSGPNPAYTAKGTVKIDGDADEVAQHELGFLQTVYESNRHFYYASTAQPSGKGAKKMTDYTKTQPGRDGDTGFEPWYGPETVFPFEKKASSTKSTRMDDTPESNNVWVKDFGKGPQYLVKTGGKDTFVSWLAVRNKRTKAVTELHNADWNVDYSADVKVDKGSPENSTVTPSGKVSVTGTGDGRGGKTPLYKDPVANDADWKTTAW